MADRTIVIPEPSDTSQRVRIELRRTDSGFEIPVVYDPPNAPPQGTTL